MSDRVCFVIAPIGEAESEIRKRSDQVLKHIIRPATGECGYRAIRADQISEPGMITSQVIQHVVEDPLVVADLTGRNPNVFYELAIRHALRRPLIQLIQRGQALPFDIAGTRTIQLDHRDLDSVDSAKKEMIAQIRALEENPSKLETPISVSLDLQSLRESGNPEERSLAEVLAALNDLRGNMMALGQRMESSFQMLADLNDRDRSRTDPFGNYVADYGSSGNFNQLSYLMNMRSPLVADNPPARPDSGKAKKPRPPAKPE